MRRGTWTALPPGMTYTYDAENRLTTESNTNGLSATYRYDADGKRVEKYLSSGATVLYVYDALGNLTAEYGSASGSAPPCTTCYYSYDHLGSVRLVTDGGGNVIARHDYLPFGEEIPGEVAGRSGQFDTFDNVSQRFTGKERDSETSLDYFGARYYGGGMGRFVSVDPLLNSGRPNDPQSWNRYTYGLNNPLAVVDPTGLYDVSNTCAADDKKCNKQFQQHAKDLKKGLENLQKQVDNMKDGPEKTRLENSLKALGTEGDHNGVDVAFGPAKGGAAATTDPIFDQNTGKYSGFNITIDPNKENNGANGYAVDAAHEGTHVSDFQNYALDPATAMQPFQIEYRGYQTSAWAAQALGFDTSSYKGVQIWNSSWGAVDRQTLQDKGITRVVTDQSHPEVQPHNPFPNN
jgi:RHS repeat-associated protein